MRWLMIALLVSLGALLLAAAGVARHILLQRKNLRRKPVVSSGEAHDAARDQSSNAAIDQAEETDQEP
jgi:hypothetical protein